MGVDLSLTGDMNMKMLGTSVLFFTVVVLSIPSVLRAEEGVQRPTYRELFDMILPEARMARFHNIFSFVPFARRIEEAGVEPDVPFLRNVATTGDGYDSLLAWLLLARGCTDTMKTLYPAAAAHLREPIVLFAAPPDVRIIASQMLDNVHAPIVRTGGAGLLRLVGNHDSLIELRKRLEQTTEPLVRATMKKAIAAIEAKLQSVPEPERDEWDAQELCFAAALSVGSGSAAGIRVDRGAASAINAGFSFTIPFLRAKMRSDGILTAEENMLAVALAGEQKTAELVGDIAALLEKEQIRTRLAITYLAKIGNEAAFQVIAEQIKPGGTKQNLHIARTLSNWPTEATAAFLEQLTKDERYRESWPDFETELGHTRASLKALENDPDSRSKRFP